MMNYKIQLICILVLISPVFGAGEIEDKADKARLGLAQSYMNLSDFEQAMPIVQALSEKYPDNEDILMNYLLILSARQEYTPAIALCRGYLEHNGENKTIQLWLARCLSWDKQYDESLDLYSKMITDYPEWEILSREKARVLGWHRQYDKAVAEYARLTDKDPNNPAFRYEMSAKRNLYNRFPISAMEYYKHWLDVEPENVEAMYDLAQIYSTQGLWSDAEEIYERILKQYSTHFRARQALEKIRMYSQDMRFETGFTYFEADSTGRVTDSRYWDVYTSIRKPLNENVYVKLRQDNIWRSFKGYKQVYQQQFGVNLEYCQKPYFWGSVNFTGNIYGKEKGVKYLFGEAFNVKPVDEWTLTFSHQRRQNVDNSMVFLNKLYMDDYKTRLLYQPTRRWIAGCDYLYSNYSDNNRKDMYGADVGYYLLFEPDSLKLTYRYENYHFNHNDPDYFSPDSFHSNRLQAEWRHYLNKEELFWGANDTYYTAQYEVIFDVRQQVGHQLRFNFYHDWNDRCSSCFEWSKMIYEHSGIYSEDQCMFYTSLYF